MIGPTPRTTGVAALLVAMLACAPSAAQGPAPLVETQIAQEHGDSLVAAYGRWVVWSSYDETSRRWRLVGRAPGSSVIKRFSVAPRTVPFDVDLGPDPRRRPTAVYSRCRQEFHSVGQTLESGAHRRSRQCRIVKLDLKSGRESTLYRRSDASLIYPTLWRDRLAYVIRGRRPQVLHLELRVQRHGRASVRQLGGAPAARTEAGSDGPTQLDLHGKNLVFAWSTEKIRYPRCRGANVSPDNGNAPAVVTRIYLQHDTSPRQLLDRGCDNSADTGSIAVASAPAVSDGFASWYRLVRTATADDLGYRLLRRSLRTGRITSTPLPGRYSSIAADERTIYAQADTYKIISAKLTG